MATRATAVILSGLAFYAAIVLAPASPDPAKPATNVNFTTIGVTGTAKIPSAAQTRPVDEKSTTSLKAPKEVPFNVKIINAPDMKAACREQTWPYITQRCLAAQHSKIDLIAEDPEISAEGNAKANAKADAKNEATADATSAVATPRAATPQRPERRRRR